MLNYISDISEKYELMECIGKGGFSEVHKALDKINHRECALKLIYKDYIEKGNQKDYMKNSILREIEIMKVCKCNNIVELYDSFETESYFILALELCDIDLLSYIIKQKNPGNLYFIQNIFLQLNNAFKIIYEKKIIHRDIKPENIYLKFDKNNKIIPKLSDF